MKHYINNELSSIINNYDNIENGFNKIKNKNKNLKIDLIKVSNKADDNNYKLLEILKKEIESRISSEKDIQNMLKNYFENIECDINYYVNEN